MDLEIIEELYEELKAEIILNGKLKNNSILITFFNMKSNTRLRLLNDSAMRINKPDALLKKGYIRESYDIGKFYITGNGIWEVEKDGNLTIDKFIKYIDSKYFMNKKVNTKLTSKERIVLLSMLIMRNFSKESCLDLNKGTKSLDCMKIIIDESNKLLGKYNTIKKLPESRLYKKGNEHIISNLIRHNDVLPKKTSLIYSAYGKRRYYLDLSSNSNINEEKLVYLLKKIFITENKFSLNDILEIQKNMNKVAYKYSPIISSDISKSFIKPQYDKIMNESIIKALLV